ncbi:terpene synthase [Ganoderma sinense ZZ0214-1]|uniref:Terpene synthase n=1 Tax=Ganoderma sinense ZZ0214-1 TaxID=1077348 RepID=A0A2G8RVP9_9APHY|nr:terpene synthase [Ganoderma sinense ZZ0214-1]WOJ44887.1 linalool/nerolidol synthase [Ganoderma sinense]
MLSTLPPPASGVHHPLITTTKETEDPLSEVKVLISDFLDRSNYKSPQSPCDLELRKKITEELSTWPSDINPTAISKIIDGCCVFVETAYGHTTHEHRCFIAFYIAFCIYIDDLGERDLDAIKLFTSRLVKGETQPDPILRRLAEHLGCVYDLWTPFGADAIIAGTLDAITATYLEFTTQEMVVKPSATRFPYYLRTRAGLGPPAIHFLFMKDWRATPESYLQIIPDMEHWTLGTNDILSFYKEELAGERNNYVHLRASAEQSSAANVLRQLVEEVLESAAKIDALTSEDPELAALWKRYQQGYLEFSLKAQRYRLAELGYQA